MWFDGIRRPNTIYVANTSRGKDSTAMLRAIQLMGWPLDMICSVDIWATQDIPAELPPMVAFKDEYDKKVLDWFGVPVTRLCATKRDCHTPICSTPERKTENTLEAFTDSQCNGTPTAKNSSERKLTYEDIFYRKVSPKRERERERIAKRQERERRLVNLRIPDAVRKLVSVDAQKIGTYGFPNQKCRWCTGELKNAAHIRSRDFRGGRVHGVRTDSKEPLDLPLNEGQKINIVHYIGIAADEPFRIKKHIDKKDMVLPLVQIGWDEDLCGLEATYMDMLAPTYTTSMRDGCWFCHNQSVGQLRQLRKNYPDLWARLMKWDTDSPVTFRADGHTVHDFDERFQLEDDGFIRADEPFKWSMLKEELNYRWF